MPEALLERCIAQHLEAHPGPETNFSWHGGEPTALGVDYFRTIVALQRKHARGRRVTNGIQTNGLLVDEEWARFLSSEGFRVGLSLDGPADLHDAYRVTRGEQPTHALVVRAFELLKRHRVPCDVLCVVHDRNVKHPLQVYRFFRRLGATYIGFLPLVVRYSAGSQPNAPDTVLHAAPRTAAHRSRPVTPESVNARAYGEFLCSVFDEWVANDTARIAVQLFEEASRPARGLDHSLCIFRETCGDMPVVERDGAFYACDHFVDQAHLVGHITDRRLGDLLDDPAQRSFGHAKRDALPRYCRECPVLSMCNGGCPKDRFIRTPDGDEGLNYLCEGLRRFFTHVTPWAHRVALEEPGRRAFDELLQPARTTPVVTAVGRNDPCPCGSGKKFKRCCGK
jgi:uncharacterized protein